MVKAKGPKKSEQNWRRKRRNNMYGFNFRIKKFLYKRNLKYRKKNPPTQAEQYVLDICKTLMRKPDTDLIISPVSGDRYIQNKDLSIDVLIKYPMVEICNHSYHYIITVKDYILGDITKYQDRVIECRKRALEKNRGRNITDSLNRILTKITEVDYHT